MLNQVSLCFHVFVLILSWTYLKGQIWGDPLALYSKDTTSGFLGDLVLGGSFSGRICGIFVASSKLLGPEALQAEDEDLEPHMSTPGQPGFILFFKAWLKFVVFCGFYSGFLGSAVAVVGLFRHSARPGGSTSICGADASRPPWQRRRRAPCRSSGSI